MPPPVFRFAPSPNGALHLGHAYSALLNFELARRSGGRFLLRIEDIDATRCRPEFEAAIQKGEKTEQTKRLKMMRDFHNGDIAVLIATDVASRGLHIPDVSHVFNFDLPNDAEDYVHRIGRTARAGADGIAISLCDGEEVAFLRDIEKLIRMTIPLTDKRTDRGRPAGSRATTATAITPHTPGPEGGPRPTPEKLVTSDVKVVRRAGSAGTCRNAAR